MSEKAPTGFGLNLENQPPEENEKMARWQDIEAQVNEIRDGLGKPIEDGIKETVVAMNALGFTTSGSCEGHTDWSEKAPWVDFEVAGTHEARKGAEAVFEQADQAQAAGVPDEELHGLYMHAHALEDEAERPMLEKARGLGEHLNTFYKDRQVPFDTRLVLLKKATWVRLINQGAMFQDTRDTQERAERLAEYQKEMKDFTEFLKRSYFETQET